MKTPKQIVDLIRDANKWPQLYDLVRDEEEDLFLDMNFKFIRSKRDDDRMLYYFKIDSITFCCCCTYESWNDWGLEIYDIENMWPVELKEVTIKRYETIPWE